MQLRAKPVQHRISTLLPVDYAPKIDEGVDHFNLSTWTVEHEAGLQNWKILVLDQLMWSPKAAASSSITDSARTSTSSISARRATSSAKLRSVKISFLKVTPVNSVLHHVCSPVDLGTNLELFCNPLWSLPTMNQSDITPSTFTQLHVSVTVLSRGNYFTVKTEAV